jgi:alkaline phosphatase D
LLDNRWNRSPNTDTDSNKTILGAAQIRWLKDFLLNSKATFKCIAIGGQFLNTAAKYENYAVYKKERQEILDFIRTNNIKNVVFLTGDRHHTDLTRTPFSPVIYELTCSPLTAGPYPSPNEGNEWQVPGRQVAKRNFGILTFTGTRKERVMHIQIYDADNQLQWEEKIKAE